ncbi:hypothetical protein GALL_293820 [mine drainage metagenome]|uniref:MtrB/PioB family decaheme-associated outer membrane protein n=1 Tax=mine drainage metagenome TaxID=410659 RepID=A0A1J5QYP4_9ZZZZ
MKTKYGNLVGDMLAVVVQGLLVSIPSVALADGDEDTAALTKPTNFVEIGAGNDASSSAKFREYNGLDKSGINLIGNFNLRGGDSYDGGDGTRRWSVTGTDLGTHSRELGATLSNQGSWRLGINYDELRHNITDTYQTPLQGSMGGNSFILPQQFGVIDSRDKPAAVGGVIPPYGAQALTPNQLSYFHPEEVYSQRKNKSVSAGYNFDPQWDVQFSFNRLDQDGAKLISAASDVQLTNGIAGVRGENILMLMNPTNYQTDTYNLALNWKGDKGNFTGGFYVSKFRDANNGVSFSNPYFQLGAGNNTGTNPGSPFPMDMLSTAPDNDFYQLNLKGGYDITPTTKLVGGFSYGINTQNDSYVNADQMQAGGLPRNSLDGLVATTHADLKLTNKATKDLTLSAGLKFNERDNRTPSSLYQFNTLGGDAVSSYNTPLSNKKTQFELAGDYRITQAQNLHVGYEFEQIERWCDHAPALAQILAASGGVGTGGVPSATAAAYYGQASQCVQVPESNENRLVANYRLKANDAVNLNAGYAFSRRNSKVDPSFYNPMQGFPEGFEVPGYVAFFDGSRTEHLAKGGVDWQANEKLSFGLNGRYMYDSYDAPLGVQNGHTWGVNLDAAYNLAEKTTITAYLSYQDRQRDLQNDAWSHAAATFSTTGAQPWTNSLSEDDTTFGLNAKQGGLMGGKLDLTGDLTYSLSKSNYSTAVGYALASCTAPSNAGYSCGGLPAIRSEMLQLKLAGDYNVDKTDRVTLGYLFQKLNSNDYYYNAYQNGYTATSMLPTNQQAPGYSASLLFLAYTRSFR